MSGADEIRDAANRAVDSDHLNLAVRLDDLELRTFDNQDAIADLPPMFVPPVMLVRQAQGQGRQARVPQAPAAGSPASCAA